MSEESQSFREQIVGLLRLLGNPEAQLAYERRVRIANVPAELFCMWFDDQYHPDTDVFRSSFLPRERLILAEFHQKFDSIARALPGEFETVAALHARSEWSRLMQAAADTLSALGEDAA